MPNDGLVIQIFLRTSAFLAVVEAMKASDWRVWAFGILAGILVLIGAAWLWLKEVYARPNPPRSTDSRDECWHVYYGDVRAGTIAIRAGNPHDTDPWEWSCGFYPGSHPGEHRSGTAATFEEARADFERAWRRFFRSEPKPIFRNGATKRLGLRKNIAALIGASGYWPVNPQWPDLGFRLGGRAEAGAWTPAPALNPRPAEAKPMVGAGLKFIPHKAALILSITL
jgi:hypothetical protein